MFEPAIVFSAQARYEDLLREAERERQRKAIRLIWHLSRILGAFGVH